LPVGEILLVVPIPFVVAAHEAVSVGLLVSARALEEVGALRVVALAAPGVVRARVQAVPVALVVGVRGGDVADVIRGPVDAVAVIFVVAAVVAVMPVPVIPVMVTVVMTVVASPMVSAASVIAATPMVAAAPAVAAAASIAVAPSIIMTRLGA
jgi:hypothetical protein